MHDSCYNTTILSDARVHGMEPVEVLDQSGSQSESEEPFPTDRDDDNHEAGPGLGAEQWVQ